MKGDIVKLSVLAGILAGFVGHTYTLVPFPVGVNEWKGQLPKELVKERVLRRMKRTGQSLQTNQTHEFDAIGIGFHILEKFNG